MSGLLGFKSSTGVFLFKQARRGRRGFGGLLLVFDRMNRMDPPWHGFRRRPACCGTMARQDGAASGVDLVDGVDWMDLECFGLARTGRCGLFDRMILRRPPGYGGQSRMKAGGGGKLKS